MEMSCRAWTCRIHRSSEQFLQTSLKVASWGFDSKKLRSAMDSGNAK